MTCVHKVRWSVKRPEDCRFRLSVSHYKDRIVAPDEYSGVTVVTPSDGEQILATKDKTVRANITVNPAPVESLATSENGTFVPSFGNVGFSEVVVDVEPSLESLSVAENGLYLPDSGTDGFDRVTVAVPIPEPALETLTVDPLAQSGTFTPSGDGYSSVSVAEQWDGTLYPIEDDPDGVFNAKYINVYDGDKVVIEGVGQGRWFGFRNATTDLPASVRLTARTGFNDYMRFKYDVDCDCILVLAGYNSSPDGGHSTNAAYQFRGDYLRYKIIHAS